MPNHIHGIIKINNRAQTSSAPTISKIIRSFKSKSTNEYLNYVKQNNTNPARGGGEFGCYVKRNIDGINNN